MVVARAAVHGLAAIALTDHDTLAGLNEAETKAREEGVEFLPGTEISAHFRGAEIHVLGYGVDRYDDHLLKLLARLRRARVERAELIAGRLADLGIEIDLERVTNRAEGGAVGRMHIAEELVRLGHASRPQDAFDKYIGNKQKAFVPKHVISVKEAIDAIHDAHGLAFLAHPGLVNQKLHSTLFALPFDGVEVYHISHTPAQTNLFIEYAKECNLLQSGGSDCHGDVKGNEPEMGKVRVAYELYEKIKQELARRW